MATPLDKYAEIQAMVQKEARDIALKVYQEQGTKYGVAQVPFHKHNGVDSAVIGNESILNFDRLPATPGGMASLDVLGNQVIDNPAEEGAGNPANVFVMPIPIIYGAGTTTAITFTGTPALGSTSATLSGAWAGTTGVYAVAFNSTEVRNATLTNGNTAVTWDKPLDTSAGSANATVIADSRFKGGDAPQGTVVGFRNDDDGIRQIWVKTFQGVTLGTWIGFDADYLVIGYD